MGDKAGTGTPGAWQPHIWVLIPFAIVAAVFIYYIASHTGRGPGGVAAIKPASNEAKSDVAASRDTYVLALLEALKAADPKDATQRRDLAAQLAAVGSPALSRIEERLRPPLEWNYTMSLLRVLAKIPSQKSPEILRAFYASLKPDDLAYKTEVVRTIVRSGWGGSRAMLLQLLKTDAPDSLRQEMRSGLIQLGVTKEELAQLQSSEARLLEEAVANRQAVKEKLERIEKADLSVAADAAVVKAEALDAKSTVVAIGAFHKLEQRNDTTSADVLVDRAKQAPGSSSDAIIRTNALASLARMTTPRARSGLNELAIAGDQPLRTEIVSLVGGFGDEAMIPLIEQMLKDNPSQALRKAAEDAMASIRGRAGAGHRRTGS